jgi:hypothetical protein
LNESNELIKKKYLLIFYEYRAAKLEDRHSVFTTWWYVTDSGDGHTIHIIKGQKMIYTNVVVTNCSGDLKESNELIKKKYLLIFYE